MSDLTLDCKGLNCPMPIVKISMAAKKLSPGQVLEVEATDLAFKLDLEAWAAKTGHTVEEFEEGKVLRAVVKI